MSKTDKVSNKVIDITTKTKTEKNLTDKTITSEKPIAPFRVIDLETKEFITQYEGKDLALSIDGKIVTIGADTKVLPRSRYITDFCTFITDKYDTYIYEGDICICTQGENKIEGLVSYVADAGVFAMIDFEHKMFYPLEKEVCNRDFEIEGDIYNTPEFAEKYFIDNDFSKKRDKSLNDRVKTVQDNNSEQNIQNSDMVNDETTVIKLLDEDKEINK